MKKGEEVVTHYYAVPEDAFEDAAGHGALGAGGLRRALRAASKRAPPGANAIASPT
jgi:hypothetical protein